MGFGIRKHFVSLVSEKSEVTGVFNEEKITAPCIALLSLSSQDSPPQHPPS